jgi:hypothetical protein
MRGIDWINVVPNMGQEAVSNTVMFLQLYKELGMCQGELPNEICDPWC